MISPKLHLWLEDIMQAFLMLHNQRSRGMNGSNSITMCDIQAYFSIADISNVYEKHKYLRCIAALDSIYLIAEAKKMKEKL